MNIFAYKNTSSGANLLAAALGCKLIRHEHSQFKGSKEKVVVNWGASETPKGVRKCKVINSSDAVETVVNRVNMLKNLSTTFNIPAFTKDKEQAQAWIQSGNEVFEKDGVYTLDVKPSMTFRVHQFPGKSVYVQYKEGKEEIHEATRTLIKETCEEVRAFLGLDFCAVTIGWNKLSGMFYVLNVNTAPEMTEELAKIYAKNILEMV